MEAQTGDAGKRHSVVFADGVLTVDGVKIPMPARPKNEVAGTAYDVLSLFGVGLSVALLVAQVILRFRV